MAREGGVSFNEVDEQELAVLEAHLPADCRRALEHLLNASLFLVTLSTELQQPERMQYAVQRFRTLIARIVRLPPEDLPSVPI